MPQKTYLSMSITGYQAKRAYSNNGVSGMSSGNFTLPPDWSPTTTSPVNIPNTNNQS